MASEPPMDVGAIYRLKEHDVSEIGETPESSRIPKRMVWLLPATIFLSAYLLFQVQPLISKFILPWFGGSPAVWTTAMLFFQCVLFGGYSYAHLTSRYLSIRQQTIIHLGLLLLSAAMAIMIVPGDLLKPDGHENPVGRILLLLSVCVGLPYFTLATTGPLIQAWFARIYPYRSPYRLYSLSNAGSFLALLTFPYFFEPWFELTQLGQLWTAGFWLFTTLCCLAALNMLQLPGKEGDASRRSAASAEHEPVEGWRRISWIALPALASLTLVAATDHVSHNVAPEPRLWITTLSLYLLTFIITFDHERWYLRGWAAAACLMSILFLVAKDEVLEWLNIEWSYGVTELRWSHLIAMFLIGYVCHGELVRLKPKSHVHLTEFYLCMSFGGACGGLFVTLVAVNFFNDYLEWPICLLAGTMLSTCILVSVFGMRFGASGPTQPKHMWLALGTGLAMTLGVFYFEDPFYWRSSDSGLYDETKLYSNRNFYGTVEVLDRQHKTESKESYRLFLSGSIAHGTQQTDARYSQRATSYYALDSGVGETLEYAKAKLPEIRVGLVGLGVGTLATYARMNDRYDFYEINPEVIRIANDCFTYLPECLAETRVVLGDARLKLESAPDDLLYDVIVLDAFTGGSVPIHLLTREAFAIYEKHLKPQGYLVVHITNRYLNLYPVVKQQAEHLGFDFRLRCSPSDPDNFVRHAEYMTLTRDQEFLAAFPTRRKIRYDDQDSPIGEIDPELAGVPLWTDHFSSINAIEKNE